MDNDTPRILIVDDDEDDYLLTNALLTDGQGPSYEVIWAGSYEDAIQALASGSWDVVLLDYQLGMSSSLPLIDFATTSESKPAVIVLTGWDSYEIDLAAMQAGAFDYLSKNQLTGPLLERAVRYAIQRKYIEADLESRIQARTQELQAEVDERKRAEQLLKAQADRNQALLELSQTLTEAETDVQKVLEIITVRVSELVGDTCTIALLSEDRQLLHAVAYYHPNPQAMALLREMTKIPRSAELDEFKDVLQTGQPSLTTDISQDELRASVPPAYLPYLDHFGIYTIFLVPLRVQARSIGTLAVSRDQPEKSYSPEDQVFLQAVADRTAHAIANAQLFQALQEELAERRRTEKAFTASNTMFESLFGSAPDPILLINPDGSIERVNRQTLSEFGYRQEELLGRSIESLIPPRFHNRHILERTAYTARPLRRPMGIGLELYGLHKDGHEFPVDVTLSPLGLNGLNQVICIVRNISHYKEIENTLRKQDKLIQTAIKVAPIALFVLDQDARIQLAEGTPIAANQTGGESIIGKSILDLYRSQPDILEYFRCLMQGETIHTVIHIAHAIYDTYAAPLQDEKGKIIGAAGAAMDISERVQIETELTELRRRLMDSLETERVRLSQELHDGPIQELFGISYLLKSVQDELVETPVAPGLAQIRASILQMVTVLRNICVELRPPMLMAFGLEKTIRSHASRFQEDYPQFSIDLQLMPDGQTLPEQTRLALFRIYQQAMSNILRHSQARHISIRLELDSNAIILEIRDDGQGFDVPKRWIDLAREGHLGLAGMSERAAAIGGSLTVNSRLGEGTSIQVTLPRQYV